MKAVGYYHPHAIGSTTGLEDLQLPTPEVKARDLLVRVNAVSVNPVDTKVRQSTAPESGQAKVLGWDAVGIVEAVGTDVTLFKTGDRVYYAGSITRPGSNSELHAVDERIVALAPTSLDDAQAAALPLTTITAYELMFERMGIAKGDGAGKTLMVVGGAGGVGSILIQLARQMTKLTVVATASRSETRQWCLDLGAHHVVDHSKPIHAELKAAGIGEVDYITSLTQTPHHFPQLVESLLPQGRLGVIDELGGSDVNLMKRKSLSLHQELMFTRAMFETPDMAEQGKLLKEVAALVDSGRIRTTANTNLGTINAANLREAHRLVESGTVRGKVVLTSF